MWLRKMQYPNSCLHKGEATGTFSSVISQILLSGLSSRLLFNCYASLLGSTWKRQEINMYPFNPRQKQNKMTLYYLHHPPCYWETRIVDFFLKSVYSTECGIFYCTELSFCLLLKVNCFLWVNTRDIVTKAFLFSSKTVDIPLIIIEQWWCFKLVQPLINYKTF